MSNDARLLPKATTTAPTLPPLKTTNPKMVVTTIQRPTPPPSSSHSMPPPPKRLTPPPSTTKAAHPDLFLDMIQGPTVPVIIGAGSSGTQYTLPVALLSIHSIYFRNEIARLAALLAAAVTANKKRKLSSESGTTVKVDEEASTTVDETSEKIDVVIRLPDVDPVIFGLFLRYIYQGAYPASVDASKTSNIHRQPPAVTPSTTINAKNHCSPYIAPSPSTASTNTGPLAAPPGNHMAALPPTSTTTTSTTTAIMTAANNTIPPSIHAWLLAQRLGATSFMNHATARIYSGIGTYFTLTPGLMHHVWINTTPSPSTTTTNPSSSSSTTSPTPSNPPVPVLTPSPLRTLLLDVLLFYWSKTPQPGAPIIIAKGPALNGAWNALFDTHLDLRREFIFGLQGGGGKVAPLHGYFAVMAPAVGGAGQGGVVLGVGGGGGGGGKKGSASGGEEDKSGGSVGGEKSDGDGGNGNVVVKKEGDGDRMEGVKST